VRPFFEWQSSGRTLPDRLHAADVEPLAAMVAHHEGDGSTQLARYWLARQPLGTWPACCAVSGCCPICLSMFSDGTIKEDTL